MFNSHIFSRFLRLVRSIRRSLFAFFVAITMLLATFVIAPTYALSAGESATSTEKAEGAKAGSTKNDGESNKQSEQSESNNTTEPNKKNTDTSSTLNKDNKESKPAEKQQKSDSNNGVDKAKSTDSDVKKNVKDAPKKSTSTETSSRMDRGARKTTDLPEACKNNKRYKAPEKCYSITYGNKTINIKSKNGEPYNRVPQIIIPTIKVAGKVQQTLPAGVWLGLEEYSKNNDSVKYAFFKGENDSYTAKSTKNSDGSIRFFASKWLVANTYRFYVVIHYPGGSKSSTRIKAILAKDDLPKAQPDDLSLSLYDFGSAQDGVAVSGNKIIIKPKSKGSTPSVGTVVSDDNKDVYDPINKLFIESKSTDKPGSIYHRMICHENGSDNYTSDRVNDLSLVTQTQFKHMENQNRPDKNAENSAVYENDDYTERSQSWISGTPKEAGTFECKVFAIKDVDLKQDLSTHKKPQSSKLAEEFGKRVKTNTDMKLLFDNPERNIVEDKWDNKTSIAKGVDWDYKTVIIQFGDKPKPKIGDNDLTLKVYPFKNGTDPLPAALTSTNNNISAMLGMELKPFVDATSAADSTKKITLRVLCSKGKKKDSGSRSEQPSEPSQPSQTAGSPQSAEDLEYKTWSSNLAELGLSVPADDNQNRCKKGDKDCNAAARTDMEVSIKPTEVGNYQCVVYALKPKALAKFDGLTGSLTPATISSALTTDPASFKENKDFAAFTFNIHSVSKFTLPHTGGQSWNLQLGILAALLVNLLAAGFVVSQSERGRKLILGRWRGLCNHV
ncbi:hypothetical protein [Gardnerella sp. DNF01198P]|uniref:hypothetical protein n=1 Tax=Gardnerella sp. DNF01198P TaxID=2749066 RepID=UPI003BAD95FD